MKDNGGSAFTGMTLRDWFAGQALPAILQILSLKDDYTDVVAAAYSWADAMLEERKK